VHVPNFSNNLPTLDLKVESYLWPPNP